MKKKIVLKRLGLLDKFSGEIESACNWTPIQFGKNWTENGAGLRQIESAELGERFKRRGGYQMP